MIVWITHVKVGHRQTPHSKALMLTHQGFAHFKSKEYSDKAEHHHTYLQYLLSPLLPQHFKASINVFRAACNYLQAAYSVIPNKVDDSN